MIDFINEDHEEMHEVLLRRGFTFELDTKWHPAGATWSFVYKEKHNPDVILFFDNEDCVCTRNIPFGEKYEAPSLTPLHQKTFKEVTKYFSREKQPTESVQLMSTITRDNIKDTLEYNNIGNIEVTHLGLRCTGTFYVSMENCPNWLEMLESYTGKLTPPPQTLTEYWAANKSDGWELTKVNDYWYALSIVVPDSAFPIVLAYIPTTKCPFYKGRQPTEQVALLNKLIEVYTVKGEN